MAKQATIPQTADKSPWLVVSRRSYSIEVEPEILGRPKPRGSSARPPVLTTDIGATFLCCAASIGEFTSFDLTKAAPVEMPAAALQTVEIRCSDPAVVNGTRYREPNRARKHEEYEKDLLECLVRKGWKADRSAREYDYDRVDASRFCVAPGDNEPEIVVLQVGDLWGNGEDARAARSILERVISYSKSQAHIGALHDFAVLNLSHGGRIIAEKCRQRLRAFGGR